MVKQRKCKKGNMSRIQKRKLQGYSLLELQKVLKKDFKNLPKFLESINDPRNSSYVTYEQSLLITELIIMHLMKVSSMNEMTRKFNNENVIKNICNLVNTNHNELAHGDTINDYLKELKSSELEDVITKQVRELIKSKKFDKYRVNDKFIVAIDGTQIYSSNQKHCDNCLKKVTKEGKEIYYHTVLEAKLILGNMVISLGSEFIENVNENASKQDCELKAFKRLGEKIKKRFPKLGLIITGDALYANENVYEICRKNKWDFVIRFKEGVSKAKYEDYLFTKINFNNLNYSNKIYYNKDYNKKIERKNNNKTLSMVATIESYVDEENNKSEKWMFITNLKIDEENIETIFQIGRSRWKIENEGFNVQKNNGYSLEHMYCRDYTAMKNHYLIIQITHMIEQMILKHRETMVKVNNQIKKLWENTKEFSEALVKAFISAFTSTSIHFNKCIVKRKCEKILI